MVFYHSSEIQSGALIFGGTYNKGVAVHSYAAYPIAEKWIVATTPLLITFIGSLGVFGICMILLATFATFFIAASWIVYALRDTAPLALARVYSRFRQYRKRINDEESWDRACPEALGDDSEEIFHIKGGH